MSNAQCPMSNVRYRTEFEKQRHATEHATTKNTQTLDIGHSLDRLSVWQARPRGLVGLDTIPDIRHWTLDIH